MKASVSAEVPTRPPWTRRRRQLAGNRVQGAPASVEKQQTPTSLLPLVWREASCVESGTRETTNDRVARRGGSSWISRSAPDDGQDQVASSSPGLWLPRNLLEQLRACRGNQHGAVCHCWRRLRLGFWDRVTSDELPLELPTGTSRPRRGELPRAPTSAPSTPLP